MLGWSLTSLFNLIFMTCAAFLKGMERQCIQPLNVYCSPAAPPAATGAAATIAAAARAAATIAAARAAAAAARLAVLQLWTTADFVPRLLAVFAVAAATERVIFAFANTARLKENRLGRLVSSVEGDEGHVALRFRHTSLQFLSMWPFFPQLWHACRKGNVGVGAGCLLRRWGVLVPGSGTYPLGTFAKDVVRFAALQWA